MDFFGIGMGEILLILVIALVIFGPERVVEIAKTIIYNGNNGFGIRHGLSRLFARRYRRNFASNDMPPFACRGALSRLQ